MSPRWIDSRWCLLVIDDGAEIIENESAPSCPDRFIASTRSRRGQRIVLAFTTEDYVFMQ